MRSTFKITLASLLLLIAAPAMAAAQQAAVDLVQTSLTSAMDLIFKDLQSWCVQWLGLFILLQFTFTNIRLLVDGADLEKVWAKFLGSLFWFGMCFYTFQNGADFITKISNFLLQKATSVTGSPFDPSYPINKGIDIASAMLEALDGSQSILSALNPFPSIMMGLVSVVILAVSALIAFKVFMIFIETKIVIVLSPLSFALLGLNAFRDQGLAPFKYLVSLAYRVMIIGAILVAMGKLSQGIIASFQTLPAATDPSVWPPIWAAAMGFSLLGALAWRVDSIAAMLASGSSQMSTGDAAAVGAVAGAAVAAAVTGGAAAGGAAKGAASGIGKAGQSMGDVFKEIASRGSMQNESHGAGRGGFDLEPMETGPKNTPAMSLGKSVPPASSGDSGGQASKGFNLTDTNNAIADTLSSGGTQKMAAAAAVKEAMKATGANMTAAGTAEDLAREGKSPDEVAHAIAYNGGNPEQVAAARSAMSAASSYDPSQSSPTASPAQTPAPSSGSGGTAGIGGAGALSATEQKLDKLLETMAQPNKGPTVSDHLKTLNDHVAREQAAVQVSMSPNHE